VSVPNRLIGLAVAFACSLLVLSIGASLTDLGPWYQALKQPSWKPPDAAFGIIWSTIFTLCAFSGWGAWQVSKTSAQKWRISLLFALNGLLNILWSWLYFNQQRPDRAMTELYFLWGSIVLLMMGLWRLSKLSSVMLLPYLVWVTTAGFLNAATIELNGPFS
jgi:tryptophan-rich sensory protein